MPSRRASGSPALPIVADTRERHAYRFANQQVELERRALPAGDYAVERDGVVLAAVERKSLADLAHVLVDGSISYLLSDLASLWRAAIVVEDQYPHVYGVGRVKEGFLPDLLARVQVRYPSVPIVFCDSRPMAEQWVYRFLGAALAEAGAERR